MEKDELLPEEKEADETEGWLQTASISDIKSRADAIRTETRVNVTTISRIKYEIQNMKDTMKENIQKINLNKDLPYQVSSIVEILDLPSEFDDMGPVPRSFAGSTSSEYTSLSSAAREAKGGPATKPPPSKPHKCAVVKSSQRQTFFLPEIGLVDPSELHPGDLVGTNKDTHLIIEKLPPEYDSRVKTMEIDERPKEDFTQIGGLDKQIEELIEAVVMPMEHMDLFIKVGIRPPKGVLLYGPPGTGKTLMARAVAAKSKATFLKLAASQLVQMYVGDGAKMVRDAFALAKEKEPTIIFIDELDAIGTKRVESDRSGDREVQRTMLELLNQLDGFTQNDMIKVIAATNRVDVLDPALLRSGRIDRKIELPLPNLKAREQILQIHSRRMNVNPDVNFEEIARMTDDFNGAQLKAVCVEAGMIALRRGGTELMHEDFVAGVAEVQAKKKSYFEYYV
ncbi:putative 26S protease regulatory subunit 6A [Monocercomonoides exilis]|uniref:putative 26S protease regulatory subunit 6A n=1 Tax=Monocercomonoides exilis TaxID=2049356 RepID=UPI003559C81F|nr:putative 26S protease regulatory subunit 6A [Monocercomonoides exilis]|eukprot:MONOS_14681.1-p1 / transcript=MONOS_14681.1 / gene=MONOS_14681 / organism=Monocercomonoides_exilis_PA203 / gene_product=26S protease regulatory subunit 6A / transcript_product=26S protease regulatory subunit 6A / location=Mono_scaffold01050:4406-6682(-) / protein_length=453 / sequence_SO=supercontig / SO=protein_coding / is_pseudo=false